MKQWTEYMSPETVCDYLDIKGSITQRDKARRAVRLCQNIGIAVLDIPGSKCKKIRKKDIDFVLNPAKK
ncbi:MAG: hypothetical protein JKX85_01285 [Phycisphaeraceae bacterium]|nr:hypothetical protein [Phycisphaeraceae bacterium]